MLTFQTVIRSFKIERWILLAFVSHHIMGFDIHLTLMLHLCSETGKPYYFLTSEDGSIEKIYGVPEVEVPTDFRKYLVGRGHHFHAYTEYFNEIEQYDVDVEEFLLHYPSWEEVQENVNYDESWTKEDHVGFEDLLSWCSGQSYFYRVSWSY